MSLWHELPAQNDRGDVAPDSSTCRPREPPGGKPWCYSTFSSVMSDRAGFERMPKTRGIWRCPRKAAQDPAQFVLIPD